MNGTLHTMNGRRWRGEITSDEVGYFLTGVPISTNEVIGLPIRTISVPYHNVSHVVWETDACES